MLPALDGLKVLGALKATGVTTPVLILSAMDSVEERVCGLKAGSDDYLTKPFALTELIARADIIVHRYNEPKASEPTTLSYESIRLDLKTHKVTCNNKLLQLQPKEFQLLQYFLETF